MKPKFSWLQKLVRKNTQPIPFKKANRWRNRFSIFYALLTWNMLGYIAYEFYKGRGSKTSYSGRIDEYDMLSPAQQFALSSGMEKAKIIRTKNLQTIDFDLSDYKHIIEKQEESVPLEKDEDNVA